MKALWADLVDYLRTSRLPPLACIVFFSASLLILESWAMIIGTILIYAVMVYVLGKAEDMSQDILAPPKRQGPTWAHFYWLLMAFCLARVGRYGGGYNGMIRAQMDQAHLLRNP